MNDSNGSGSSHSGEGACTLTAEAIAELVGGELRGDPDTAIAGVAPLDRAERHHVSIFAQARYASLYGSCGAGVVLVETGLADFPTLAPSRVVVARPHDALLTLLPRLYPDRPAEPGIHPAARIGQRVQLGHAVALDAYCVIGDDAVIGDGVWIGSSSTVGERVLIGSGSRIFPNVTIYSGSRLGERAIIHSGARIGSDGFGYVFRDGRHVKIPHVGRCLIGSDVEIGANTTIDRGSIDDTVVGDGTKIDNLVQVGHNVRIGRLCTIMAQVGIAGSAHIEDGCVIAGQAGIGGHLTIGAGAKIAGQAGVFGDVPAGESWSGYPARPHAQSLRAQSALFRISSIIRKLEQLIDEKAGP